MAAARRRRLPTGVEETVRKTGPRYRGSVYDAAAGVHIRGPWYPAPEQAASWRTQTLADLDGGRIGSRNPTTFRQAREAFTTGIRTGRIQNRSGRPYKPSVVAGYTRNLNRIEDRIGAGARLDRLDLPTVQRVVDQLVAQGLSASNVRSHVTALKAMLGWGRRQGMLTTDPTTGLLQPTDESRRERIASVPEAEHMIDLAVDPDLRAVVGLAVYAGLRASEIRALRWEDLDLAARELHVERASYAQDRSIIALKSRAARRDVPILDPLLPLLEALDNPHTGWLFPGRGELPLSYSGLRRRLARRRAAAGADSGLTLHELRHTCASILIASGANAKAISEIMGHSSITVTFDRYGHLMPGARDEVRGLANAYLKANR